MIDAEHPWHRRKTFFDKKRLIWRKPDWNELTEEEQQAELAFNVKRSGQILAPISGDKSDERTNR